MQISAFEEAIEAIFSQVGKTKIPEKFQSSLTKHLQIQKSLDILYIIKKLTMTQNNMAAISD